MPSYRMRVAPRPWFHRIGAFVALVLLSAPLMAQTQTAGHAYQPLDGMQFRVKILKKAGNDGLEQEIDELVFRDGAFFSTMCKQYNFDAAPYWIRFEGGQVHFQAELTSPTDGTMLWNGVIRDKVLEGTMRWTKKRWYWTIDVEHKIRGELSSAAPSSN